MATDLAIPLKAKGSAKRTFGLLKEAQAVAEKQGCYVFAQAAKGYRWEGDEIDATECLQHLS